MDFLFLLIGFLILLLMGLAARFVTKKLYRKLRVSQSEFVSVMLSIIVFCVCFGVLILSGLWILLSNIQFER